MGNGASGGAEDCDYDNDPDARADADVDADEDDGGDHDKPAEADDDRGSSSFNCCVSVRPATSGFGVLHPCSGVERYTGTRVFTTARGRGKLQCCEC